MKTERRTFLFLIIVPALMPMTVGCNGSYGGGGGGGGGNGSAPYIIAQPANQTVALGQTAMFTVAAGGTAPLSYQWQKNGASITGATLSSYTTPPTTTSDNGSTFDVVVSNTAGVVTSNAATLTVTTSSSSGIGWTYVQDSPLVFCQGANKTGCNIGPGNMAPTVAGSVWVLQVQTPNNVTMASVTGGGGTWVRCPNCHVANPSGYSTDAWYNLSGNAGTYQGISFTLSGNAGAFLGVTFLEMLPPPGTTAFYDDSGSSIQSNCTTCIAVTLNNITGTDVIIRNDGGSAPVAWNSWSAPYITDSNGYAIGLNLTDGAGPTVTYTHVSNPEYMAIAFRSSAGVFTPPAHRYSVVNFTVVNPSTSCGTCTVTIPATGANHLLFIQSADEVSSYITSVSGGGTWVVPSGANSCRIGQVILSQNNEASCAYNLSSVAGTTSLTVTMSGNGSTNFAIWEIASTVGNFVFDTQASVNYTSNTVYASGPAMTLNGQNDVIFSLDWCVGGSNGPTFYPIPYINAVGTVIGPYNYFLQNEAASVVLLDSALAPTTTPVWINPQNTPTFVTGVAFTAQ